MQTTNGNNAPAQRKALSEEQINRFWIDGYLNIGKILQDDEIELLRREYDREFERARSGQSGFRNLAIDDTDDLDAAGGQGDDGGLRMIDLVAHVEEGAGVGGAFVLLRTEVGAGDELHGAVVDVDVVES